MPVSKNAVGTAWVVTTNVIFESRGGVDRERLVKYVASIDPLSITKVAIFSDDQRVGRSVSDVRVTEGLVEYHQAFGWIVGAVDSLPKNSSVVTRATGGISGCLPT